MDSERWELGSDFHAVGGRYASVAAPAHPWGANYVGFSTGRDCVLALRPSFRRLRVPAYFCSEVVESWRHEGIDVALYHGSPWHAAVIDDLREGDAVLAVDYFGVCPPLARRDGFVWIEDRTHDPWASGCFASEADYAFASIRKSVPTPDGAVLWSPRGRVLPSAPPPGRSAAVLDRLSAMLIKARYLAGDHAAKEAFRACAIRGEEEIARGAPAALSEFSRALLSWFDVEAWRAARRANWRAFRSQFADDDVVRLFDSSSAQAPFSIVLEVATPVLRDTLRQGLIGARVYPAILWDLEGRAVAPEIRSRAGCMLSIACDGRYDAADMTRLAEIVDHVRARLR